MDQVITTKSDLERMLLEESMEAKPLSLSLLKSITNNFSHEIGRRGFAVVYKGTLEYGEVAVKKLSQNYIDEKKFIEEVHCLMKTKHKNIVRCIGYCADTQGEIVEYNGKFVMADVRQRLLCFEYVPNGSLDEYIKDASREWEKCYNIIKGVCEGLHYLHNERIVHLDLKPANILLDNDMVPKITEFGISRCFDELETHVVSSKLIGSMGYLAPELFCNNGKITFKSDIYSLGIIIIEILTGDKGCPEVEKVKRYQNKSTWCYLRTLGCTSNFGGSFCYYDFIVDEVQEHWSHKLEGSQKELHLEQIRVCTEVAQSCLQHDPEKRPSAQTIIDTLERTEREERCIEPGASSHNPRPRQWRIQTFAMSKPLDPKTMAGTTVEILIQAIHKLYAREAADLNFEELYRGAYSLVLHSKGAELYSAAETTMASEVQSLCRPLDDDDDAALVDSTLFLQELLTKWDRHIRALQFIRSMFLYMDRTFVLANGKTPTYELGLRLWRDEMARSDRIRPRLIEAVERQKAGEDELVPGVNKMLTELGAEVKDKDNVPFLCFKVLSTGLHVV